MTVALSLGSLALGACGSNLPQENNAVLYHASFRSALQAGVYEGVLSVDRLRAHGDFGLGATDSNDGELVAYGGKFFRSRPDGTMSELGPADTTPYAIMTHFRPQRSFRIKGPIGHQELEKTLDAQLDPGHRIYAIRIRGRFESVEAGNGDKQEKPHRLLEEVLSEYKYRDLSGDGTLVGFRCPAYMQRFDRVGYHFHYLSDRHDAGGHVRAYRISDVEIAIQELSGFTVEQPSHGEFYERDIETPR